MYLERAIKETISAFGNLVYQNASKIFKEVTASPKRTEKYKKTYLIAHQKKKNQLTLLEALHICYSWSSQKTV